jgi:sugar lactone lactonase YvrE
MIEVEYLLKAANQLGEDPLWHAREKDLYWVDYEGECFLN